MLVTEQFIESIRPKRLSCDDKYSVNMYRFLKSQIGKDICVYETDTHIFVGWRHFELVEEKRQPSGWWSIQLVRDIFKKGVNSTRYALPGGNTPVEIKDWLLQYQKRGKCFWFGCRDFTYTNNTRKCIRCGKWQKKSIKKYVEVRRVACWE